MSSEHNLYSCPVTHEKLCESGVGDAAESSLRQADRGSNTSY